MTNVPDELMRLESAAWEAIQSGDLPTAREAAAAVQQAITAHATSAGVGRYVLEMAVKRGVRHPSAEVA